MKIIISYVPFVLLGLFIGVGPFNIDDWQWWAMIIPTSISISVSQFINRK